VAPSFEELIAGWSGRSVVVRRIEDPDAWIFIALHDDTLGTPVGGTRMKVYDCPADGLRDALRLARGMTHKWAAIDLGFGGGKGVIALREAPDDAQRRRVLQLYAETVNGLRGGFATGRDLGTTDEDMLTLARVTPYVHGVDLNSGVVRDPGPYTAAGVFAAIRAGLNHLYGSDDPRGRTVCVQGLGDVGAPVARMLHEAGAALILSDLDPQRLTSFARELEAQTVGVEDVYAAACDIFAPCAVGAILNDETIPRLACRAVIGSANNQLAQDSDAERLMQRGILYAPDFIANGGGALAFGLINLGETDESVLQRRLAGIQQSLEALFAQAAAEGISTLAAARQAIDARLAAR